MTAPRWGSYIAVGDSFTEGLWDPAAGDPERQRGWADRLADALSARRTAAGEAPLRYANLAVRGLLLEEIVGDQLPRALHQRPDLVSIVGGGNDLLRPGADPDRIAARLEEAVRTARTAGADVLLGTSSDTRGAGLLAAMRDKTAVLNAHLWSMARRHDAFVLDLWGLRAVQDWREWAQDRIHLTPGGHHRVAQAALVGLGLEPDDEDWDRPRPPVVVPRAQELRESAQWLRRDVYPWATRRLRRASSGDGRVAKYPELRPWPAPQARG